jgi:hypothetical protein
MKAKQSTLINKGMLSIYWPLISLMVLPFLLLLCLNIFTSRVSEYIFNTLIFISLSAIPIGWLYWSYKSVKWKIWAFSKIDLEEIEELYFKAIQAGLIWPKGSIFNKTEIWSKKDKQN